jgi:hypothetical protein
MMIKLPPRPVQRVHLNDLVGYLEDSHWAVLWQASLGRHGANTALRAFILVKTDQTLRHGSTRQPERRPNAPGICPALRFSRGPPYPARAYARAAAILPIVPRP